MKAEVNKNEPAVNQETPKEKEALRAGGNEQAVPAPDYQYLDFKADNKRIFSTELDAYAKQSGNEVLAQPIIKKEAAKGVRKFMMDFYEEAKKISPQDARQFLPSDELNFELANKICTNLARTPEGQVDMFASVKNALDHHYGLKARNSELSGKIPLLISKIFESEGLGAPFYKGKVMTRVNLFRLVARELAEGKKVEDAEEDLKKKKEKEEKERKKKLEEAEESISESES